MRRVELLALPIVLAEQQRREQLLLILCSHRTASQVEARIAPARSKLELISTKKSVQINFTYSVDPANLDLLQGRF